VAKSKPTSDERLDELYREHPDGFVAGRDALAEDLRGAGDRAEADRVKKLRRPTTAAWLLNRAALSAPRRLAAFAKASREVEEAQRRALEGDDAAVEDWRAAAGREREAAGAVVDAAESSAREEGHPATPRALELVGQTLRAAAGDSELRERVLRGRVERERSAATLGTPAIDVPPRRAVGSEKRRDLAQARRELKRLSEELGEAAARRERLEAQVKATTGTLRQEKARLAEAKRATSGLERQVRAAERRAKE
jgi:hypothetical protein